MLSMRTGIEEYKEVQQTDEVSVVVKVESVQTRDERLMRYRERQSILGI